MEDGYLETTVPKLAVIDSDDAIYKLKIAREFASTCKENNKAHP